MLSQWVNTNTDWHIVVPMCGKISAHKLSVKLTTMGTLEWSMESGADPGPY